MSLVRGCSATAKLRPSCGGERHAHVPLWFQLLSLAIRATTMLVADFGNRSRPHNDMAIVDYDFYNGEAK